MKRCTRLEGKYGVAIVPHKLNSGRAVRFLMHLMEKQGIMVDDFATVRSPKEFSALAERFANSVGANSIQRADAFASAQFYY